MRVDMAINFDKSGNPVKDKSFKDFKTAYLKSMTKVHKFIEHEVDNLKVKYNLTNSQYDNIVNVIANDNMQSY